MTDYLDLQIGLDRWFSSNYRLELQVTQSDSDTSNAPLQTLIQFDFEELLGLTNDNIEYGRALTNTLFAAAEVRNKFSEACSIAENMDRPLRIHLLIAPRASELHDLRWETLHDPRQDSGLLVTNERILFSRYLSSTDWRPVRVRPKGQLRALVVIANPSNLSTYAPGGRPLEPINVAAEQERAQKGLGNIPVMLLASEGTATLNNVIARLHDGVDVLYIVCHGAIVGGEPRLWLEDEKGQADVVAAGKLVEQLRDLDRLPTLIVLASCESAGSGEGGSSADSGVLAALGPHLAAEADVPAIVAMQGNISMNTIARFMPVFFTELQRDGQVDRAMTSARGAIRDTADFWVPVLFMRLRSGRIWYVPGFAATGDRADFKKWTALTDNIRRGICTPILGTGLLEPIIGTTRELAQRWASTFRFPMAPYEADDLPQVAQFLSTDQQSNTPNTKLAEYVLGELLGHFGDQLPPDVHKQDLPEVQLPKVLKGVGEYLRKSNAVEPHKVLASLPIPIYLTTNPDDMLTDALREHGKSPQRELFPWNPDLIWPTSVYETNPDYTPSVQEPLVYHMFGHVSIIDSVVLKEDDYFDYLIGVTRNKNAIPVDVRRALASSSLLFLGFRMDDWDFRALFKSLLNQEGSELRRGLAHIAAQLAPEEGRNVDPEGARRYIEGYYSYTANISIYWGTVQDFIAQFCSQWAGTQ